MADPAGAGARDEAARRGWLVGSDVDRIEDQLLAEVDEEIGFTGEGLVDYLKAVNLVTPGVDEDVCGSCDHEFRREASRVDGRVLWFHYGTEAVGPKGDAALCRCVECQTWFPPTGPKRGAGGHQAEVEAAMLASVGDHEEHDRRSVYPVLTPYCACTLGAPCTRPAGDDGYCDECRAHAPGSVEVFA